jgi:N-acylneuraminate cytidylyltransferase
VSTEKKRVAIITARGGSKRIPRKNIRPFWGKPIIEYSIQAALDSGIFEEVMVSTDDPEISQVALKAGAKVPFLRSAKNSDDHATTAQVILEVLEIYEEQGRNFSEFCCLYPTAPFVTAEKLRRAMKLLEDTGADTVIPVVRFGYPIQRALKIEANFLSMMEPKNMLVRSQDLSPAYHDCGQVYGGLVTPFLLNPILFAVKTAPLICAESEVQDIDTDEDWKIAELKFQLMKEAHGK